MKKTVFAATIGALYSAPALAGDPGIPIPIIAGGPAGLALAVGGYIAYKVYRRKR